VHPFFSLVLLLDRGCILWIDLPAGHRSEGVLGTP
jgi:hypothetical protein